MSQINRLCLAKQNLVVFKFVALTEPADQRQPLILLHGHALRLLVFFGCSNGLLSEKAFQQDNGMRETVHGNNSHLQGRRLSNSDNVGLQARWPENVAS